MTRSIVLTLSLILVLSLGLSAPASATETACFDWTCYAEACFFDASCSTHGPGGFYSYRFAWGDGSSSTSSSTAFQHTYNRDDGPFFSVKLTILAFGAGGDSAQCQVRLAPPIGPVTPETGHCE